MEEIGEIAKAILEIKDYDITDIHKEINQAITLLIRLRYSSYHIKEGVIIK